MDSKASSEEIEYLRRRMGRTHARQRLGIEAEHEAQVFGYGTNFFHFENSRLTAALITLTLKATGSYWRGNRNAEKVELRRNEVASPNLPRAFAGFTLLHLSDLHVDISGRAMRRVAELIRPLDYDICVLTGDYRGATFGPIGDTIDGLARLAEVIAAPIYAVLGNHDSIRMLPGLERLGFRVLLNETEAIERDGAAIHIAGIDDAHFYRADNLARVADEIPHDRFSILLSHTPEIYRQAAHADFKLMLCGHTHGGQICLPGGFPITLDAVLPRRYGAGAWRHHQMQGYTSVGAGTSIVPVRFNCAPEITLHTLKPE
jgi:predicted MPP superfamily phosphohydrolase